jgi:type II secretory pathway pseudopilin PulG
MTQYLSVVLGGQEARVARSSNWRRDHELGRSRRHATAGFTFLELLILFIVVGILVAITGRSVSGAFSASARRSATREVTSYLYRTRGIAIQQSRSAWLVRNVNVLKILVDSSGTKVQLGTPIDLLARYTATLTIAPITAKDTVQFDPRGFIVNIATTPKLIITRSGKADTLCITGLGRITTRSCP